MSLIALCSPLALGPTAIGIITDRLAIGWLNTGVLAIGCGILMSFAVQYARFAEREVNEHFSNWLPLLFAVPTFILCGFPHCIVDAFYASVYCMNAECVPIGQFLAYYASIVIGNFIGCNVYKLLGFK